MPRKLFVERIVILALALALALLVCCASGGCASDRVAGGISGFFDGLSKGAAKGAAATAPVSPAASAGLSVVSILAGGAAVWFRTRKKRWDGKTERRQTSAPTAPVDAADDVSLTLRSTEKNRRAA